jgi:hypothetical protein
VIDRGSEDNGLEERGWSNRKIAKRSILDVEKSGISSLIKTRIKIA